MLYLQIWYAMLLFVKGVEGEQLELREAMAARAGGLESALRVDKVKDVLPPVVDWEDPPLADEPQVAGLEAVRVLLQDLRLLAIPMETSSICTSRFPGVE